MNRKAGIRPGRLPGNRARGWAKRACQARFRHQTLGPPAARRSVLLIPDRFEARTTQLLAAFPASHQPYPGSAGFFNLPYRRFSIGGVFACARASRPSGGERDANFRVKHSR